MDIKQVFEIIKRWLWLMALGAFLGAGLGYYFSNRQTPIYQATTRFVVLRAVQTTYDYYAYLDSTQLVSTYAQLLSTESLLYEASNQLGFPVVKGQATAKQIADTQFVELTVKDTDPYKAAAIANGLVSVLIDQNEILQSVRYDTSEKSLQDRIDQAQEQINLLENQIKTLSATVLQEQITTVQTQIDNTQSEINDIRTQASKIDPLSAVEADQAQYTAYQSKLDELESILSMYQQIYTDLVVLGQSSTTTDSTPRQLEQLNTTLNLYQQIYLSSISSLEALRLAKAQNTPAVVQVEKATKPTVPVSPKPMQTAMLAGLIGLLITAGIAFLVEFLDDTIKTPDDVKNTLDTSVIGFIGDLHKSADESLGMYVAKQPRSPVSEAFRSIRTNLDYSSVDNPVRVILVTSPGESEGKSTIASNLAIVEAQSGKSVLLVDADMRRPKGHVMFNKPNRMGLSEIITGKLSIEEAVKSVEQINNLSIITCGNIPPNPSELLGSNKMAQIINEFRNAYDFIVVDSPPMLVSDAAILSTKVDGVIFVVIPGQTRVIAASRPMDELKQIGANILGVVVNRIPKNRGYYYGGYNYYSPYQSKSYHYYSGSTSEGSKKEEPAKPARKTILKNVLSKEEKPQD